MTGVIWIIQVVHYPLFARVGAAGYPAYQAAHMRRITWVVGPVMLVELGTGVGWLVELGSGPAWVNLGLLGATWLSTALLQVPAHSLLLSKFDETAQRKLVRSNWIRTVFWSGRSGVLFIIISGSLT